MPRLRRGAIRPNVWRIAIPAAMVMVLLLGATSASAVVSIENYKTTEVQTGETGAEVYDYRTGTPVVVTDFVDGTHTGTSGTTTPGSLTLAHDYGTDPPQVADEPWWDKTWRSRRCFEVDHHDVPGVAAAQALDEYQFRIELDTASLIAAGWFDADASDVRVVRSDGSGGFVRLEHWTIPSTINTTETVIWVELDALNPGTDSFCLYHNQPDPVPDLSDQLAVFTYATGIKPLYYAASGEYTGSAGDVTRVAGYAPSTSFQLDAQPLITSPSSNLVDLSFVNAGSLVQSDGPLASVGLANAIDTLVPASYASTEFVVPTNRGVQTFTVQSPWATTTVQFHNGTAPTGAPVTVSPAMGAVTVTRDVSTGRAGLVTSTNQVPFLLTHANTSNQDSIVARPPTTDDLFGIFSRQLYASPTSGPANITLERSDGGVTVAGGASPDSVVLIANTGAVGTGNGGGPAVRVTDLGGASQAIQQRDDDGVESSSFWPLSELDTRYLVPTSAVYMSVACPLPGTVITFGTNPPVACNGTDFGGDFIGKALRQIPAVALGTATPVTGNLPFYLYYEQLGDGGNQDETNALNIIQGRQFTFPTPELTARTDEGQIVSPGMWESAPIDTGSSGIYGLVDADIDLPAGANVRFRLATADTAAGPWNFVGPVDDPLGWYGPADLPVPAAHIHDGDGTSMGWLKWYVELEVSPDCEIPRLDELRILTDIDPVVRLVDQRTLVTTSLGSASSEVWLARITTDDLAPGQVRVRHDAPLGPGALGTLEASASLESGPDQTTVTSGTATQTGPPIAGSGGQTHSVRIDHSGTPPGDPPPWDLSWELRTPDGPVIDHPFTIDLTP